MNEQLETSAAGLSEATARSRLAERGFNEVTTKRLRSELVDFLRSAFNPLVAILLTAALASAWLGEPEDAMIIATIVLMSAGLNAFQTFKSARAMRQLNASIATTATVRRDGRWCEIPRREIVMGDLVRVAAGDLVPADLRLIEAADLHIQQAALTGESLPVEKKPTGNGPVAMGPDSPDMLYLGTSVISGYGTGVVFATGKATAFGDVVASLAARPDETEFERGIRHFSLLILRTVIFLVLFILVVNISLGRDAFEAVLFSVALAVGLTPEFLPVITSVTLAQGAVCMAREKVVVKHLPAMQNLGSIDVLCSDKTGTITTGAMSFAASLGPTGAPSERPLFLASLNARFETGIKSPFDAAILARSVPGLEGYTKVDELPFDFERRRLSVVVEHAGERLFVSKGAPESVIAVCSACEVEGLRQDFDSAHRSQCLHVFGALGKQGYRVLAVAYRRVDAQRTFAKADEKDLTLAGFVTFADEVLCDAAKAIGSLQRDGIVVKVLSGDNELVTRNVCEKVGLDAGRIILGSELDAMSDVALVKTAEQASVFARVTPVQKHRIVRALKAHGHVVGFMGDGINDAPSLHDADVGISVSGAVDVAREASDIILLENRLEVLHAGIIAGRKSFANVLKYLLMGTSSNFGNMLSMAGASLFLPFLPMLPTQILLNNFLYDVAQLTIPTDNVDPAYVKSPQRWDIQLVRNFMLAIGPVSSLFDFLTFYALLRLFHFDEVRFHTGWFVESLATQALVLFVIRTTARPWASRPSRPLAVTTLGVVVLALVLPYTPWAEVLGFAPLPFGFLVFLGVAVIAYLVVVELVKRRIMLRLVANS